MLRDERASREFFARGINRNSSKLIREASELRVGPQRKEDENLFNVNGETELAKERSKDPAIVPIDAIVSEY